MRSEGAQGGVGWLNPPHGPCEQIGASVREDCLVHPFLVPCSYLCLGAVVSQECVARDRVVEVNCYVP